MKKGILNYQNLLLMALLMTFNTKDSLGQWAFGSPYPGGAVYSAASFAIGTKAYVGGGNISQNSWYEYDTETDTWTPKGMIEGGVNRASAIRFAINGKGYVGCGSDFGKGTTTSFYEYNPSGNSWTKKADFPGGFRHSGFYTSANGKGYVICGNNDNGNVDEVWEYNPKTDKWTEKTSFPGGNVYWPAGFVINDKIYVGTGSIDGNGLKKFYEYDPGKDKWTKKSDYPGSLRTAAIGFSVGTRGYIGGGTNTSFSESYTDFYEYSPALDQWFPSQELSFASNVTAWSTAFVVGKTVYMGTGASVSASGIGQSDQFFNKKIQNATGIDKNEKKESKLVQIYPNPTSDVLKVNFDLVEEGFVSLAITNIAGQVVEVAEMGLKASGLHTFQIPVSRLESGLYHISLRTEREQVSQKFSVFH